MEQGRIRRLKGVNQYVLVVERVERGRVVRHTSPRMGPDEVCALLRAQGMKDDQIEAELHAAPAEAD